MSIRTRQITQYSAVCCECGAGYCLDDGFSAPGRLDWFAGRDRLTASMIRDGWITERCDRAYCESCATKRETT